MSTTIDIYDAQTIRKAMREQLGYNSRQVSVRRECYSMGSSTYMRAYIELN